MDRCKSSKPIPVTDEMESLRHRGQSPHVLHLIAQGHLVGTLTQSNDKMALSQLRIVASKLNTQSIEIVNRRAFWVKVLSNDKQKQSRPFDMF